MAPNAGSAEITLGSSVSTVKAAAESKGAREFPLRSRRPRTETDAAPEGIVGRMVSSPLQVSPVYCRLWNWNASPAIVASTWGSIVASTPECRSMNSSARVTV